LTARAGDRASTLPVATAGACAFLGVYAPQPLLPMLSRAFAVREQRAALVISALTLGVAFAAPLAGAASDRHGRVPFVVRGLAGAGLATLLAAAAPSLPWLVALRFVQGVSVAAIVAVAMAYVGDEWPERPGAAMSAYVTGTVLGGFLGRAVAGAAAATLGWRAAFAALGAMTLAGAGFVRAGLPPSRRFTAAPPLPLASRLAPLRDPRLVAAFVVGAGVLFTLVATFTYVGFHLDRPPYSLGPGALGALFAVYLLGLVVTPLGGRLVDRAGHRAALVGAAAMSSLGLALTLVPHLAAIVLGLALASSGTFVAQATATSFVGTRATGGRAAASGLYLSFYYAGGALGAVAPARAYEAAGWPGCIALLVAVQLATAAVAAVGWRARTPVSAR
jgi:predicted MFS family arabinose efflux permease